MEPNGSAELKWCTHESYDEGAHLNQIRFMLYHERECKNKENVNFGHTAYLVAKLCNPIDGATSVISCESKRSVTTSN